MTASIVVKYDGGTMKMTTAWAVRSAADWEGGLFELITSYGMTANDLPDDFPGEIIDAWNTVYAAREAVDLINLYLDLHADDEEE